jgi:molybdopterin-dependent oxidoreductase alpha subunit
MALNKPTQLASLYLQPKVGGDFAAMRGMAKALFQWDAVGEVPGVGRKALIENVFISEHTVGFEDYRASVEAESWEAIEEESALTRSQLESAAAVFAKSEASIVCWAMGLTQQKHAVRTIRELVNVWLLRGQVGKAGAGLCPVRGHSNVQGDRTMGITENPKEPFLAALDQEFGIDSPRWHGYDAVSAIEAMARGEVKTFFCLGGNFAAATPDTDATEAAMRQVSFQVHVATKLNRTHLLCGEETLLLPCLGRSEIDRRAEGPQKVTVEDSMSCVHASHGKLEPAGPKLLSEPAIVARAARAALPESPIPWDTFSEDYREIRKRIEKTIPGFQNFEARLGMPGGFYLGNAARDRKWNTASGKAEFLGGALPRLEEPAGTLRLMTLRSHDQYNTTLYGLDDRYRGIQGERRVLFVHPEDLRERGFSEGRRVTLVHLDATGQRRVARDFKLVEYDIPRGCAAAYFPETNVLFPLASVTEKSRTPTSKYLPILLEG